MERERKLFVTKLAQQNDKIQLDIEVRRAELEKLKESRKKEFLVVERAAREEFGAAPTEMIQNHRNMLLAIDEQMLSEQQNTEKVRSSVYVYELYCIFLCVLRLFLTPCVVGTITMQYRREEDEQARVMFDRAEAIKLAEMERRKAMASENIARIRMEVAQKVRAAEAEWQVLL